MSRFDDTVRPHRPHRLDTAEEIKKSAYPPALSVSHAPSVYDEPTTRPNRQPVNKILSNEETLQLAKRAVDLGLQDTKRSLAGSEGVEEIIRPKLTIDLGHANISWVPEAVVDIIKDEVARLSLSNNHIDRIPHRFSECSHLRYLNVRANNFTEFPRGVFNLNFLEILDLSRNKITKIPEEVRNLTSLRVFSIMQNLLEDLPSELSDMNKLQIIKVSGNPLKYPLKSVSELKGPDVNTYEMADGEKDSAMAAELITAELKRFLKSRQHALLPDADSIHEAGEMVMEYPKPPKRGNRFPVIPRASNGSDSAPNSRSPSLSRAPPIPTRSHHRMASGQGALQNGLGHRPGITPYGASERNRSNSEGVIQSSAASRIKRMGLISRKNTDLGTLDEMRPYRNSHFRGLSHGSILRSQRGGVQNDGSNSSSPNSPREKRRLRHGFFPRMSSLPEHRVKTRIKNPIIKAAKSVLYSLFQIHPNISSLIDVLKTEECRRSSLEIVFYNASTHIEQLNDALQNVENTDLQDKELAKRVTDAVKLECATCIMAYTHVGTQLRINIPKIVTLNDPKYIRSLLFMIFGSLTELRNACICLGVDMNRKIWPNTVRKTQISSESIKKGLSDREIEPSVTPTKDRRQAPHRLRSETTVQLPTSIPYPNPPPLVTRPPSVASFSKQMQIPPLKIGNRSRSSSRSNTMLNTSGTSSMANTPRSGESFGTLSSGTASRINPITGLDELEEDRIFEKIFVQLSSAYKAANQAVPLAARQFAQCLELAVDSRAPQQLQNLCNKLLSRCRTCLDVSDTLDVRLSNMTLKEPGGGMRNQREFWQLCKTFIQAFVELVLDIREAKNICLLPSEIVATLRIVQKSIREAGRLIDTSPWSYLAELHTSNPAGSFSQLQTPQFQHSSSTSMATPLASSQNNGPSPQSTTMPATPLSAALGPAAQATIPSTPISAASDRFFAGDVFQRADSLLSMSNTAPLFYRR